MMNTEIFTGKAEVYANARPGYPHEAVFYITGLIRSGAVVADIGAGTGKLTEPLARYGYDIYAVEPNADMRGQLAITLQSFQNVRIIEGTAEVTTLPDKSVDIITCAQALHWFDPEAFRAECRRIGRPGVIVIAVYNYMPDSNRKQSTEVFFRNPTVCEFPNPISYTRDSWLKYMTSHSHDPLPFDSGYEAHMLEMNAVFERESENGYLRRDVVTTVYSESLE